MDTEKVKWFLFTPLRILLSDGSHYDVTHPDQVMVIRRWSYIGVGGNGQIFYEDNAVVENLHITRIEPLWRKRKRLSKSGK